MKSVTTSVWFSLLLCGLASAQVRADGKRERLSGDVHTVRTEFSSLSPGSGNRLNGPRILVSLDTFDTMGNRTETVHYARSGSLNSRTVTSYNAEGIRIESETYEAKGKLSSKIIYKSDEKGRVSETATYDEKRALVSRSLYSYDDAGRRRELRREEKEEPSTTTKYKYDESGRPIEIASVNDGGELVSKTVYAYSPGVALVEHTAYKEKIISQKTIRVRDEQKHRTDVGLYRADGEMSWKWSFVWDEQGNVTKEEFNNDLLLTKSEYAYEFDQLGNWVKRTKSGWYQVSGKPTLVPTEAHFRAITYYPQPYAKPTYKANASEEALPGIATGDVLQGEAIRRVEPEYPLGAKSAGIRGSVVVEVTVDEEGNVLKTRATSGPPMLRGTSEAAAKAWKFRPTLSSSGMPVRVIGTITFNFNF
jgi:TonB family protein